MASPGPLFDNNPLSVTVPDGTIVTRDHAVIRQWAIVRQAEPATGAASKSGPPTVDVNDGGSGVRFNFPGAAPFRPIGWDEWFENFDNNQLVFVYEEPLTDPLKSMYRIEKRDAVLGRFPHLQV
jgi:hypothetical protein